MLFGFFAALRGKHIAAHGGKFGGELKEPCALGLPQPFRALWKLMQDTTEKQPRNPQNGRWFARDSRRRTPRLRQQREIADEPGRPDDPRRNGAIAGGIHRDRSGEHHKPVIGNFVTAKQNVAGAQNACFG
jgi:hypothetical protein